MLSAKHGGLVAKELAIAGLIAALVGLLLMFRYGMPFHVEGKGHVHLVTGMIDQDELKLEQRYRALGYVGLAFAIIGTALQVAGVIYA
jgi:hypothetical protein